MKKRFLVVICVLMCLFLPLGLVGCKDKTYSVFFTTVTGATISADKLSAKSGETIVLSCQTYAGYEFQYFTVDGTKIEGNSFEMPKKDVKVSARLQLITYHINYHIDEETTNANNQTTFTVQTSTFQIRPASKPGYTFISWYTDSELSAGNEIQYVPKGTTKDIDLYPKFEKTEYHITYYLDNGTNSPNNPSTFYFDDPIITLSNPTKDDCQFIGWYSNPEFTGEIVEEIDPSTMKDYTIYARYLSTKIDSDGYRLINNLTDFIYILQEPNLSSGKFKLMADIDLLGVNFTPIGSSAAFSGELDGNGHIIENISLTSSGRYGGFFASLNNAAIRNLALSINYRITSVAADIVEVSLGGIAGYAQNSSIENCKIVPCNNTLSELQLIAPTTLRNIYIGGILGDATETTISNCHVSNTHINAKAINLAYVGGLCGRGASISQSSYTNSKDTSISVVMETGSSQQGYVGGLIGYLSNSTSITNSLYSSVGKIIISSEQFGASLYAGGIAGKISRATISYTYSNLASISATATKMSSTTYVAGFVGEVVNSTIEGCFSNPAANSTNITSNGSNDEYSYIGYFVANSNSATLIKCYSNENMKFVKNGTTISGNNITDRSVVTSLTYILNYVNSNFSSDIWELHENDLPTLKEV